MSVKCYNLLLLSSEQSTLQLFCHLATVFKALMCSHVINTTWVPLKAAWTLSLSINVQQLPHRPLSECGSGSGSEWVRVKGDTALFNCCFVPLFYNFILLWLQKDRFQDQGNNTAGHGVSNHSSCWFTFYLFQVIGCFMYKHHTQYSLYFLNLYRNVNQEQSAITNIKHSAKRNLICMYVLL